MIVDTFDQGMIQAIIIIINNKFFEPCTIIIFISCFVFASIYTKIYFYIVSNPAGWKPGTVSKILIYGIRIYIAIRINSEYPVVPGIFCRRCRLFSIGTSFLFHIYSNPCGWGCLCNKRSEAKFKVFNKNVSSFKVCWIWNYIETDCVRLVFKLILTKKY